MKVSGLAALVTGGGSGLGAGTAAALAKAGAKVALLDVNEAGANEVAARIGGKAFRCDVSDEASAVAAIAAAREAHGPARILINCAGIAPAVRIVGKEGPHDLALFTKVIAVNLIGTFNMMRLAVADMSALDALDDGERGIVISTASVAAFEGQIGQGAYSASKGGVAALTLPAAREFARMGVRVLTIAPGIFATPMMKGMSQTVQDSLAASIPFPNRLGTPEDYAKLVLHMIDNVMLNGEVIRLDGAIRMQPK